MNKTLRRGVSFAAMGLVASLTAANTTWAQDSHTPEPEEETVVVTGVRKSLQSAQQIKKNADTVVDSITADDIGAFPDKSVAEALQRVAGITVNRFAATGDTAHFSAEPSGVIVRGLQQVRSEFNGRDIFTADSNRGLSWSDVSPELMGGIDVYKNQTADLIEGGIAGTISLRTRLPFDQKGRTLAATAEYTYGDLVEDGKFGLSGIYSDRWDTSLGEFGVMLNVAHSEISTNSEGIKYGRIGKVSNAANWGTDATRYIPSAISVSDNTYNRTRDGASLAAQWQNHDKTMLATFQYNVSRKHETWEEYVMTAASGVSTYGKNYDYVSPAGSEVQCLTGTSCTFDGGGFLTSGTLVTGANIWKGSVTRADGSDLISYDWSGAGQSGTDFTTTSRYSDGVNDTRDASLNFKWEPTARLKLNFDVQHIEATQTNYDITADLATYQNVNWDLTGALPHFTVSDPSNINISDAGITDAANYRLNDLMDHITDSDGSETAVRLDAAYSFDSPWLQSLKVGVRHAERDQTVRWTTYNWASVVNNWSSYGANDYFITGTTFPSSSAYGVKSYDENFFGGGITNAASAVFFDMETLKDLSNMQSLFGNDTYSAGGNNAWQSVCSRDGLVEGCFRAAEIARVSEVTDAAYLMLKFGGNDATIFDGVTVSGNIGLRYVETRNESTGGVNYNGGSLVYSDTPTETQADGTVIPSVTYYISNDDRLFMTSDDTTYSASTTHRNWLPSANVRFGLSDTWFVRLAASRALARPDIGNLKYYKTVGMTIPTASELTCGAGFTCDSAGNILSTNVVYTAQANNPYLKPITADQIDLSVENYFSNVGSFTFNLFYKRFNNYIQYGKWYQDFTNNGVTRSVEVSGPVNGDGASIRGFEVAYQRFFDFLPAPFDGLGVQMNYTHLKNSGITSTGVAVNSGDGSSGQSGGGTTKSANTFNDLPLEGLSDDTVNLVSMFEKGQWSARLAYNWRSEYLVTAQDCCVAYPVWQRAAGYLDARLAYRMNASWEVSLEGSNLLNTRTELMQQVEGATDANPEAARKLVDYAWYQNDRRLQATIRMKF